MPQFNQTHTVYHLRKDCYVDLLVRRTIEHVGVLSSNIHFTLNLATLIRFTYAESGYHYVVEMNNDIVRKALGHTILSLQDNKIPVF